MPKTATKTKQTTSDINLDDSQYYFNRELTWLEFNYRVLHEALDARTPLLEKLKFLAIFSSNLDEFFMVRVAGLKMQVEAGVRKLTPDGRTPSQQLQDISKKIRPLIQKQDQHFEQVIKAELADQDIHLLNYSDLNKKQCQYLETFFVNNIFPVLTPLAVDPSHPFPYISNLCLNLAVLVKDPENGAEFFARVKVPQTLPRFIEFPENLRQHQKNKLLAVWTGVPLEQVIAHNLECLFPGMEIMACYPFRITRNARLEVEEDEADDLLLAMEDGLRKQKFGGSVVRIELNASMPESLRETLLGEMDLGETDVYEVQGLLGMGDLMSFMGLSLPQLKAKPWTPAKPSWLNKLNPEEGKTIFEMIAKKDLLVHHPYYSFRDTVQEFITQAAHDPQVLTIKMTLYRTSGDSPIINALMAAAEKGKQVVALVEIKARFDEQNNIIWAKKLEQAGVHVVYGLVGLKTHTKVTLVVRQERNGMRRYFHIGTGNYNPKTARIYTDLGLLSCNEEIGADLSDLFNYLTGYSRQKSYRKLLISPVSLRDRMMAMIEREKKHCQDGGSGHIVAKMNSLVDKRMIKALYEASQAGVKIDLIVRGICCLRPGVKGVSDNIRVISIVGQLLEHSRIFYFHNGGDGELYLGSADWMTRNLDRRVEAITPVENPDIAKDIHEILSVMLADNRQAWELQSDGGYVQRYPGEGDMEQSSQDILMERANR